MIVLTDDDVNGVRQYIAEITRFLETYTWLTGAYVSDFFFKDYWSKLPQGWQRSLCQIQTDSLADLLTHKQITSSSSIPPLSLLCFQACCQKLSLDRHQEKDVQDAIGKLTDAACSINQGIESDAATMQPTDVSGQLHAYFRKHVKPKKQHEITNLGKVIWHLSKARSCGRVVDVGSGLGHLARLLAFGHGLHVTSIEASDSHAPKASEYDREIDREIKKKMEMLGDRVTRPKHVTSMIYPNMTTTQFLAILDSDNRPDDQRKSNMASESDKQREATMVSKSEADKQREATMESESEADKQRETNRVSESEADKQRETNMVSESEAEKLRKVTMVSESEDCDRDFNKASLLGKQRDNSGTQISAFSDSEDFKQFKKQSQSDIHEKSKGINIKDRNKEYCNVCDSKTYKRHSEESMNSEIIRKVRKSNSDYSNLHGNKNSANIVVHSDICSNNSKSQEHSNQSVHHLTNSIYNQYRSNLIFDNTSENYDIKTHIADNQNNADTDKDADRDANTDRDADTDRDTDRDTDKDAIRYDMHDNTWSSRQRDTEFILTGLHACGDLTPTVLRFFVRCDAAVGLASVGCCYMKLTDDRSVTDPPGFPMSEFVSGLPHHQQSYVARELACHFADTYYQRLKADSSHLKIHSYRAALEWLAHQLNPAFQRSSVQIPAKKTNTMDFESYARLGLRKLGISCDHLTNELLAQAVAMTTRWREVVAFYTLRLALAPVVETLVLLDRMLYLNEQGLGGALVPIFDPNLSPRNFVLLSCKQF